MIGEGHRAVGAKEFADTARCPDHTREHVERQ